MLSPQDLQTLRNNIANSESLIATLEPEINKARLAGVDVSSHLAQLTTLKEKVRLLKLQYGSAK